MHKKKELETKNISRSGMKKRARSKSEIIVVSPLKLSGDLPIRIRACTFSGETFDVASRKKTTKRLRNISVTFAEEDIIEVVDKKLNRRGEWSVAPLNDEYWDGVKRKFREKVLTKEELRKENLKYFRPVTFWIYETLSDLSRGNSCVANFALLLKGMIEKTN
eukprot:snap_masked-scaffold_1-processed-gene-2.29-mRNA-1 protein AED:1.00 eAED:1.00 QI:0/-1/0/0/-1/1/1/0/162